MKRLIPCFVFFILMANILGAQDRPLNVYGLTTRENVVRDYSSAEIDDGEVPPEVSAEEWIFSKLGSNFRAGQKMQNIHRRIAGIYSNADLDGDGISESDRQLEEELNHAKWRATQVTKWANWDINGDGRVTREEVRKFHQPKVRLRGSGNNLHLEATPEQRRKILDDHEKKVFGPWDLNKDDVITFDEATHPNAGGAKTSRYSKRRFQRRNTRISKKFDLDGDGVIAYKEFQSVTEFFLLKLDPNRNGVIDESESFGLQERSKVARRRVNERENYERALEVVKAQARSCQLDPIDPDAELIFVHAHNAYGVVKASIGDDEKAVGLVDINVEPGTKPLHIVANSRRAQIWRVFGARDRIRKFVVSTQSWTRQNKPRVGVVGLHKSAVSFVKDKNCFSALNRTSYRRDKHAQWVKRLVLSHVMTRKPDRVVASEQRKGRNIIQKPISRIHLPSGKLGFRAPYPGARILPTTGESKQIWEFVRRYDIGVVDIAADRILANAPVKNLATLPGAAGLAELVDLGVLEPIAWENGTWRKNSLEIRQGSRKPRRLGPDAVPFRAPVLFRILKPFEFPGAGLSGFLGVGLKFVLASGVPAPTGNVGRACIYSEQTGALLIGEPNFNCRDAIR